MHLYPPELEIEPEEGFTAEKDIFARREFGDQVTNLVSSLEDPLVLLLDDKYGTGKTTFIKMWLGELSKLGIPNIYFDAFASDYHEDAFLTIAGEIIARAENLSPKRRKAVAAFKTQAVGVAKALGRASLRVGVRVASIGLLTGEEFEGIKISGDAAKIMGDETAKALDDLIKERLDSHAADRETFDRFREALSQLACELAKPTGGITKGGETETGAPLKPLVFVIDELDRCRPPFALELLERIKHFFSVQGVVFVLVSSLDQLEMAVRFAYGQIDARTYLEKFYHLRLLFPAGRPDRPDMSVGKYLGYLLQEIPPGSTDYGAILQRFASVRKISLRTLERIHAYLNLTTISMPKNSVFTPQIIAVLCALKVLSPELYDAARSKTLSFEQLDSVLRFASWRDQYDPNNRDRIGENVENHWRYVLGALDNENLKSEFDSNFFSFRHSSNVVTYYCDMIDCFALPSS